MGGSALFQSGTDRSVTGFAPLSSFLDGLARDRPNSPLLRDAAGRESWSGRPARSFTTREAWHTARDLSSRLLALRLAVGSRVGICLPNGSELSLSLLAAERAGLVPVLMPATASPGELERIVDVADLDAVITQARLGTAGPASLFRQIASRRFRLRFLLAFGPDVPGGVIDLDAPPAAGSVAAFRPDDSRSPAHPIATVGESGGAPTFRSGLSWIAAAAVVVAATRWQPGDTVVATVAPDDLKGLATGWLACPVSGAVCESHPVVDRERIAEALARPGRTHLVLPGWTEGFALAAGLCDGAASILFVHSALAGLPAENAPGPRPVRIADAVAFGEVTLVAACRGIDGTPAIRLDAPYPPGSGCRLVALRRGPSGGLQACGPAVARQESGRRMPLDDRDAEVWHSLPSG